MTTPARKFTIADGMILVGATALALAWISSAVAEMRRNGIAMPQAALEWALLGAGLALPLGVVGSLAVIALRLRGPRPPARRLRRQPGMVACLVASLGCGLAAAGLVGAWGIALARGKLGPPFDLDPASSSLDVLLVFSPVIGLMVATSWITLALAGRWRPEACWIDRAGRLLALFWIATVPVVGGYWILRDLI